MYAIVETGGKQYKVCEGDYLFVEKLSAGEGEKVIINNVLAVSNDSGLKLGSPYLEGANVSAKVIKQGKEKKIIVFKFKPKIGYKRKQGHRQPYTKIQIEKING